MLKIVRAAAAAAALVGATALIASAQRPQGIQWEIGPRQPAETGVVQFGITVRDGNGRSQNQGSRPLSELQGLSPSQLAAATSTPVRFRISGDAGALDCQGEAGRQRGSGTCSFAADPRYAQEIGRQGLGRVDERTQLHMLIHKVTLGYIGELRALGAAPEDANKALAMAIHDVTPDYVRSMHRAGYPRLTGDELVAMSIHGVTPEFVGKLHRLGYSNLPASKLTAMAIHGVDPALVAELGKLAAGPVSADDLVAMSIHGVTPDFVRALRGLGYSGVSAGKLVAMRIHGVTPDFIQRANAGGERLDPDELVSRRIHSRY